MKMDPEGCEDAGLEDRDDAATTKAGRGENRVFPGASGGSLTLPTPKFQPRDTDFEVLASKLYSPDSLQNYEN